MRLVGFEPTCLRRWIYNPLHHPLCYSRPYYLRRDLNPHAISRGFWVHYVYHSVTQANGWNKSKSILFYHYSLYFTKCPGLESNQQPFAYQANALTNWATGTRPFPTLPSKTILAGVEPTLIQSQYTVLPIKLQNRLAREEAHSQGDGTRTHNLSCPKQVH